jgi:hypothetical protein
MAGPQYGAACARVAVAAGWRKTGIRARVRTRKRFGGALRISQYFDTIYFSRPMKPKRNTCASVDLTTQ